MINPATIPAPYDFIAILYLMCSGYDVGATYDPPVIMPLYASDYVLFIDAMNQSGYTVSVDAQEDCASFSER